MTDDARPLTLHRYRHHFRDRAFFQQEHHGVAFSAVRHAMEELGCGDSAFPPGPGMVLTCNYDILRLPVGTVAYQGDPARVTTFGLFVRRNNVDAWGHLLGGQQVLRRGLGLVVESVPGVTDPPDWLVEEPTDATAEEVAAFKRRAWVVSGKVHDAQGWCGTYFAAMREIGLDESVMRVESAGGVRVGDRVNVERSAGLPVGSVLRYATTNGGVRWYARVEDSANAAGTRRIFGYDMEGGTAIPPRTTAHYNGVMEVMHLPAEPGLVDGMDLDVNIQVALPFLPPGTVIRHVGVNYVVSQTHDIGRSPAGGIPVRGGYHLRDFAPHVAALRVVQFGPIS